MAQERFAYLFQRYVDKSCSPEESDELMAMLRDNDESYSIEFVLDNIWEASPDIELKSNKSEEIFAKVISADPQAVTAGLSGSGTPIKRTGTSTTVLHTETTVSAANPQHGSPVIPKNKNLRFRNWLNWAAVIFIVGAAGLLLINPPAKRDKIAIATAKKTRSEIRPAVNMVVVKTSNEHQKVTLPDGSTVILNNNSSVSYPSVFDAEKREIFLSGEGYFDIKHDATKTFTVNTGKLRTTVLGTAFNIRAYDNDKDITVTVTRGKVSVLGDQAMLSIVTPNQQIVFNKGYKKYNVAKVVAKNSIQWQESDLFFDDISMEQAVQLLSTRFNTPIVFDNNKVAKCRFTATFLKGETLDEILKVICSYNNAQYESAAGGITIKGNGCEE